MDPNLPTLKIVIVEDNAALADIYKTRLSFLGYDCHIAYDGRTALALIERVQPNLVLLDLMVPEIAGDQILKTMRSNPWGKNIKVLIISNLNEVDAPAGLREQGIEGYAVKANLSNDAIDTLVDNILKPEGQTESTDLESPGPVSNPMLPPLQPLQLPGQPLQTIPVQPQPSMQSDQTQVSPPPEQAPEPTQPQL